MSALPTAVTSVLHEPGAGRVVVFDADGTLWRGDVGEDFLRHLCAEGLVPEGSYARYDALHQADPPAAYAFAVTVMKGLLDAELAVRATDFFTQRFVGRVFPYVRPLLAQLRTAGYEVWVCSASPRWVVEPGAAHLGIASSQVIAVDAALVEGRLTERIMTPVPAGPGKVEWLRRKNVAPVLAIGNGDLDLDMLAYAQAAWVIAPPDAAPSLLTRQAKARNWPVSRF